MAREERRNRKNRGERRNREDKKVKLLYVDDDQAAAVAFESLFRRDFKVYTAESGDEGLEILKENKDIILIVSDYWLMGKEYHGDVFLEKSIEIVPEAIRFVLSGHAHTDIKYMINSINMGQIFGYIKKPYEYDDAKLLLDKGLETFRLKDELLKTQEELIEKEKLAQIGYMASGIAHEVRNQLAGLGIVDIIKLKYKENPDLINYSGMIETAKNRIMNIVDEIRDYVRQKDTNYKFEKQSFKTCLDENIAILKFDRDVKHIPLEVSINEDYELVFNKDKIGQVILNLVRNAGHAILDRYENDYQEKGLIKVEIDKDDEALNIRVGDNGTGIKEEHLERIFEPLFSTKGKKGTGLGLELCQRIVEQGHKGKITVESTLGEGTTFTIKVPLNLEME